MKTVTFLDQLLGKDKTNRVIPTGNALNLIENQTLINWSKERLILSRSTITQSFWISQVLLSSTDLLKRVMTGIANPIAIGIAQLNQTNTVICQLSSFFSKYYPMAAKRIYGFCGSIVLTREGQKQRKAQLEKVEKQQPDRSY